MAEQIVFDRSLYLTEAVEAAAAAYSEHATIEVTPGDDSVRVVISGVVDNDPKVVSNAFCNHVLHETISRRRQAELRELG
jgi:hypothetical protein